MISIATSSHLSDPPPPLLYGYSFPLPPLYILDIHSQPFMRPNSAQPFTWPNSATTGYPFPAIYVTRLRHYWVTTCLRHYWASTPSHLRGPTPPLLGIHSQPFTWPNSATTGHPLPAIYVAQLRHYWVSTPSHLRGPSPPLLGIHSQPFTWPAFATTGYPLPAIYVAHLRHYWVSTPSHLRGPPSPLLGIHSQPFTWPDSGPPPLGIQPQPFTWPIPAYALHGNTPIAHFPPLGDPRAVRTYLLF